MSDIESDIIESTEHTHSPGLRNAAPAFSEASVALRAKLALIVNGGWFHASIGLRSGDEVTIAGDGAGVLAEIQQRAVRLDVRNVAFVANIREGQRFLKVTADDLGYMAALAAT